MSAQTKAPTATSGSKRPQFTPRPPRPAEERLPKLYRGLTDQVDEGHFTNAIKTCKKILFLDPKSESAFQTLLFLYLHTDDYSSALALVDKPPTAASLDFERAYCLYRLHREREALTILEKIGSSGRKEQHLEAQIRYRLGEYEKSQQIYDDLLAGVDSSSPEHPDILTNHSATTAHLDFHSHGYHSFISAPPPVDISVSSSTQTHIPTEGELETYVPSLPTGWAIGGIEEVKKKATAKAAATPASAVAKEEKGGSGTRVKKRKHRLPKGAVEGKAFSEDPDRWLPLRQRASFVNAMSKKKGQNLSMGTGMTQGSTTSAAAAGGGGGGGGGGKKKKGKK